MIKYMRSIVFSQTRFDLGTQSAQRRLHAVSGGGGCAPPPLYLSALREEIPLSKASHIVSESIPSKKTPDKTYYS